MMKESKANLIFVVLLIGSMIPGVVILVRKKLNGDGASAANPDPVPSAVAYNQPPPTPPGLPRKEPLIVRDWVQRVTQEKVGIDVSTMRINGSPVVSDAFFTQALALTKAADNSGDLWLMIWRDTPPPTKSDPEIALSTGGTAANISLESVDVPPDIRHALQGVGYIDPPQHTWVGHWKFRAADVAAGGPFQLRFKRTDSKPAIETLLLP